MKQPKAIALDRLKLALVGSDQVFRASEAKWGVGRLEYLVAPATLAAYRQGWIAFRAACDALDAEAVERLTPKLAAALAFMDAEATAAGHAPLAVDRWEAPVADGSVLVLVRTLAEAHAVAGMPDERRLTIFSLPEVAAVLPMLEAVCVAKQTFPGAVVRSGVQGGEGDAADWGTADPLSEVLG
jgi:hypothetical protein